MLKPWLASQPKLTSHMNRRSVGEKPESRMGCASLLNPGSTRSPASLGGMAKGKGQGTIFLAWQEIPG